MKHLVEELKARADEQIATMRDAALRARDTHARAELMRHMLMTANHVKAKPTAEAVAFIVDHWLEAWGLARDSWPHVREIAEAPESIRKTLRGRLTEEYGLARVTLGEESLPRSICEKLKGGRFKRIWVIGQGTAAVAGMGVADALRDALQGIPVSVLAMPATEVSGFHLRDDMSDTLFIAISQSGTTTDTNRTVDLLRARGASVLGIVNRRHSDLTERVDGVLYTSDGRDVEMSVASTKAFYSQVAAGTLLGEALAEACGVGDPARRSRLVGRGHEHDPLRSRGDFRHSGRPQAAHVVDDRRTGPQRGAGDRRPRGVDLRSIREEVELPDQ